MNKAGDGLLELEEGTWVKIKESAGFPPTFKWGVIRGVALVALPVVGRTMIVDTGVLSNNYSFSCVAVAECHLEIMNP